MRILKKKHIGKIILLCAAILITAVCVLYLGDFYHADTERIDAFSPEGAVESFQNSDGYWIFEPEAATAGFIFYPGGKVDHAAYIPLMERLAAEGIFCVLVKMPCHLAVLDMDAAEGIPGKYPQIENWYIGGHSLGGAMAASYLSQSADLFDGLVLLGAYSTADLSETGLSVLSVYGSEDRVMDREKYGACKENLPADFTEILIDGGCHAYFGMYGLQEGDGNAAISNEEQILLTAKYILAFLNASAS